MSSSFKPPASDSLAKVDVAENVVYEEQCTVVEGVVSPESQSGWPGQEEGYDVHCFTFANWRLPGKPLVGRKLVLLRPVPPYINGEPQGENPFSRFPAYSIQRLTVLLSKDHLRAVVSYVQNADPPDETLAQFAERLRQPVVISTDRFGEVVLNPTLGWFEGKAKWNRKIIEVHFEADGNDSIGGALKVAESLWSEQAAWKRKIEEYAVKELLPLKNDSWLAEDEEELEPADFKKRMKLTSITVSEDGRFEFWHGDGDLFGGHAIQIGGNLIDGVTDADIPG